MHGSENKLFLQCPQARVFIKIQLFLAQLQKHFLEPFLSFSHPGQTLKNIKPPWAGLRYEDNHIEGGGTAVLSAHYLLLSRKGSSLILQTGFSCYYVWAGRFNYILTLPLLCVQLSARNLYGNLYARRHKPARESAQCSTNPILLGDSCHHHNIAKRAPLNPLH